MKTFADVKRRAQKGAKMTLIATNVANHKFLNVPRRVVEVRRKEIGLSDPLDCHEWVSYLDWPKASEVTIIDADTFEIKTSHTVLRYRFD